MSDRIDETYTPRPKRCAHCNHIIGVVMRVTINGSHAVRKLYVLRAPILVMPNVVLLMDIQRGMYRVHGLDSADGIECEHCGYAGIGNSWYPSQESLHILLDHYETVRA